MGAQLFFATSTTLPSTHRSVFTTKRAVRCTLAPEQATRAIPERQPSKVPKHYQALPANLPRSARPPPPPVHRSVPFVGFLIDQLLGFEWTGRLQRLYGDICTSNFFLEKTAYVSNYSAIVEMLRDAELFRSKDSFEGIAAIFGSDSMIGSDGQQHTAVRGTVSSAFSPALFPVYFPSFCARTLRMWEGVMKDIANEKRVLLEPVFREHYLSIIVEITTGIKSDSSVSRVLSKHFGVLSNAFFWPQFGPVWNRGMKAKQAIVDILQGVVASNLEHRADDIEKLRKYGDKLLYVGSKEIAKGGVDALLIAMAFSEMQTASDMKADPKSLTTLCNMILLLWFAGYTTSAATSSSALFELGWEYSLVEQLRAEQEGLISAAGGNRELTYNQVNKQMPLLDSYITEILRLHPAVTGVQRKLNADAEILGHYVEKGLPIFMDFSSAMRDQRFFPDPNNLKIDRFVKRDGKQVANRVLSFGGPGSPHYCIGGALAKVLMKTTFAVLLRYYEFTLDPTQSREYILIPDEYPKSKVVLDTFTKR